MLNLLFFLQAYYSESLLHLLKHPLQAIIMSYLFEGNDSDSSVLCPSCIQNNTWIGKIFHICMNGTGDIGPFLYTSNHTHEQLS